MSIAFRMLYSVGFTPWEQKARAAMGREISAVAAAGRNAADDGVGAPPSRAATGRRKPRRHRAAHPEWKVTDKEAYDASGAPFYRLVRNADPRFYRLRRE